MWLISYSKSLAGLKWLSSCLEDSIILDQRYGKSKQDIYYFSLWSLKLSPWDYRWLVQFSHSQSLLKININIKHPTFIVKGLLWESFLKYLGWAILGILWWLSFHKGWYIILLMIIRSFQWNIQNLLVLLLIHFKIRLQLNPISALGQKIPLHWFGLAIPHCVISFQFPWRFWNFNLDYLDLIKD